MKKRIVFVFITAAFLALSFVAISVAEEQPAITASTQQETTQQPAVQQSTEPVSQWVWGEVTSVDMVNKQISLRYIDYESDQEKTMVIAPDDKTTFENAKSIDDIRQGSTLSIDYLPGNSGVNIAKNISLEKPMSESPEPTVNKDSSSEVTPLDVNPEAGNTNQNSDQSAQKTE